MVNNFELSYLLKCEAHMRTFFTTIKKNPQHNSPRKFMIFFFQISKYWLFFKIVFLHHQKTQTREFSKKLYEFLFLNIGYFLVIYFLNAFGEKFIGIHNIRCNVGS